MDKSVKRLAVRQTGEIRSRAKTDLKNTSAEAVFSKIRGMFQKKMKKKLS
jgi:hypothetical protein